MSAIKNALRFFKPFMHTESKMLGRWNLKHCSVKENVSALYANTDHCGDSLCGSPKDVAILVEKEKQLQKLSSVKGNKK